MTGSDDIPVIVVLSPSSLAVANRIKNISGGEIHGLAKRVSQADIVFDNAADHLGKMFAKKRTIIGVMAAGAAIRLIAPHLDDKHNDPPVLVVSDDGLSVVPLLGGHHGANQIARFLAEALDGHAAITTAGDVRFGLALDEPPNGWVLSNPQDAKEVMAALLAGESVKVDGEFSGQTDWLKVSNIPVSDQGNITISFTENAATPSALQLIYKPKHLVLGVGCERGADADELIENVTRCLIANQIDTDTVACISSIDLKADETALHILADHLGIPLRLFTAEALERETPRLANPSDIVFAEVGCHGVAEGAALAAVGFSGNLILPKQKSKRTTVAIGRANKPVDPEVVGRARGHLSIVGIGPGSKAWRSPEVTQLVGAATELVGYSLYLDLLGSLMNGKIRHDFDLGTEEDRVRHAMELAGQGKNVALVCSGDAGIYAMATLVYELLDTGSLSDAASRVATQVSPGISALQAAAARAGAPLGHDFCTISLSDLLTPWQSIKMRLKAAAEGDFVIAFYNPVSKRRRTQLAYARDVLLQHRPDDTPVILATNLGREGELVRIVSLVDLQIDDVDMLTVVIVGSSDSRTVITGDGRTWVYTPRGYAAKQGSKIGSAA